MKDIEREEKKKGKEGELAFPFPFVQDRFLPLLLPPSVSETHDRDRPLTFSLLSFKSLAASHPALTVSHSVSLNNLPLVALAVIETVMMTAGPRIP